MDGAVLVISFVLLFGLFIALFISTIWYICYCIKSIVNNIKDIKKG